MKSARARLSNARESLATYSAAILGASPRTAVGPVIKLDEYEAEERRAERKDKKLISESCQRPRTVGWIRKA